MNLETSSRDLDCCEVRDALLQDLLDMDLQRILEVPDGIDIDHVEASFKRGVLRVILPKTAGARERIRQIPVSVEA